MPLGNKHCCATYSNLGKVLIIQVFYDYAGKGEDSMVVGFGKPALPKNKSNFAILPFCYLMPHHVLLFNDFTI